MLTGGACALGALIVPRSCRTARQSARQPPVRCVSLRESGGGCGACGRSRGLLLRPPCFPHLHPTLLSPFRLRHPRVPHTQDENALPGTTQQRLDGFGHGPAIAYSQHHLQPLRLGESLPAAARLSTVTAAPLCLSGSRRAPLRTRRAASQALALGCREPPTPPPSERRAAGTTGTSIFCPHHPGHPAPAALARTPAPVACFPMA